MDIQNTPGSETEPARVPATVRSDSLPHSLFHSSRHDVLNDARAIAEFLHTSVQIFTSADFVMNKEEATGCKLCFDLLIDKLDIGREAYHFPLSSSSGAAPELCKREKW